ncbi:MAG TPA: hypothetical protein VNO17_08555 [Actinomycetota bacterium]|nr:hypothetical protein [Actinomycetota bacterium]
MDDVTKTGWVTDFHPRNGRDRIKRLAVLLLVLIAAACSGSSTPEPDGEVQASTEPARALDEEAILAMLKEYLRLYNNGDYIQASGFLSSRVEAECGGPTALAFALSQNHRIEGIDYDVKSVRAWGPDDPTMADVTTVESYGGHSHKLVLGLAFVFERGDWKLDDLYPLGAGAFCE